MCRYSSIFLNMGIFNNALALILVVTKKLPWTPSPPGWVCVCTFSKERLDDLLHECISFQIFPLAFTWWKGVNEYFLQYRMSRGTLPIVMLSVQRRGHHYGLIWRKDAFSTYLLLEIDMYMVIDVKTGFGWFFFFLASCLLYNHEEWNIFFHDFGTWCLSFCTSVCVCVGWEFKTPSFQEKSPAGYFWMLFQLQETDEARMRSWGEVRLRSVAKMDFETYWIRSSARKMKTALKLCLF